MARPREFDPEEVLAGALDVFWHHGYENASLPMLLDGMGLTRGSFYKAFTDKKSLFLLILQRYENVAVDPAVALLSDPQLSNGIDRIEKLFGIVTSAVWENDRRGCLLCSTIADPAILEEDVAEKVHGLLEKMRHGFKTALQSTDIPNEEIEELTEFLLSQYVALRVLARAGEPHKALAGSSSAAIRLLHYARRTTG